MQKAILFTLLLGWSFISYSQVTKDSFIYLGYGYALVAENDQISINLIDQHIHDLDVADTTFKIIEALSYTVKEDNIAFYYNGNYLYDSDHNIIDTAAGQYLSSSAQSFLIPSDQWDKFNIYNVGAEGVVPGITELNMENSNLSAFVLAASGASNDIPGEQVGLIYSVYDSTVAYLVPKCYSDTMMFYKSDGITSTVTYTQIPYRFSHKVGDGIGRTRYTPNGQRFITTCFSGHVFMGDIDLATGEVENIVDDSMEQCVLRPYGAIIFKEKAFVPCVNDSSIILLVYNIYTGARIDSLFLMIYRQKVGNAVNITTLSDKIILYTDEYCSYFRAGSALSSIVDQFIHNLITKPEELFQSYALPENVFNYSYVFDFGMTKLKDKRYKLIPNKAIAGYSSYEWLLDHPAGAKKSLKKEPSFELTPGKNKILFVGLNKATNTMDTIIHWMKVDEDKLYYSFDTLLCSGDRLICDANFIRNHFGLEDEQTIIIDSKGSYSFISKTNNQHYQVNVGINLCQENVANAFTPNGDGHNDVFQPVISRFINSIDPIKSIKIVVMNRDRKVVFESTEINGAWDGNYRNVKMPEDVYVYSIDINYANRSEKILGEITLIR